MNILSHANKELTLTVDVNIKSNVCNSIDIKRVQEWLCLHGFHTATDGVLGPATVYQIELFQRRKGLIPDRVVGQKTFRMLTEPMREALSTRMTNLSTPLSFRQLVVDIAKQHLKSHPREVGGQNRGPWVRLYMQGNEGDLFAWCAGFTCFIFEQAAAMRRGSLFGDTCQSPLEYTFSCDALAQQARKKVGDRLDFIFKREENAHKLVRPGDIFLNRHTDIDWVHTGIVTAVSEDVFHTIEGNTNDTGSREGYEVCARTRAYINRDFITYDGFDREPQPINPLPKPIMGTSKK